MTLLLPFALGGFYHTCFSCSWWLKFFLCRLPCHGRGWRGTHRTGKPPVIELLHHWILISDHSSLAWIVRYVGGTSSKKGRMAQVLREALSLKKGDGQPEKFTSCPLSVRSTAILMLYMKCRLHWQFIKLWFSSRGGSFVLHDYIRREQNKASLIKLLKYNSTSPCFVGGHLRTRQRKSLSPRDSNTLPMFSEHYGTQDRWCRRRSTVNRWLVLTGSNSAAEAFD